MEQAPPLYRGSCLLPTHMIDPQNIYCMSSLYDSSGIVFEYEGRVFRALYERGVRIFELLSKENWIERLVKIGLVHIQRTNLQIPGYHGIIEVERIRPIVPPSMWTTGMLMEAAIILCRLCNEILARDLLIWDLKGMSNMTFCAKRGPVFLDLGAFHTTREVETNALSTSVGSLFDQIAGSFYVPLWLANSFFRNSHLLKRLLEYHKAGDQGFNFTVALLRRLTLNWKLVPGLLKASRRLNAGQYRSFYSIINKKLEQWQAKDMSRRSNHSVAFELNNNNLEKELLKILLNGINRDSDKVYFDLYPKSGYGLKLAEHKNIAVYLVTADREQAESFFALRRMNVKPFLPIFSDIWDRSFHSSLKLREGCDVVYILPDLFEITITHKVPMDFLGRVLSILTRRTAIVGIGKPREKIDFPSFVSPPEIQGDPVEFVRSIMSKYFREHEVIQNLGSSKTTVLILNK